eukprot:UN22824
MGPREGRGRVERGQSFYESAQESWKAIKNHAFTRFMFLSTSTFSHVLDLVVCATWYIEDWRTGYIFFFVSFGFFIFVCWIFVFCRCHNRDDDIEVNGISFFCCWVGETSKLIFEIIVSSVGLLRIFWGFINVSNAAWISWNDYKLNDEKIELVNDERQKIIKDNQIIENNIVF